MNEDTCVWAEEGEGQPADSWVSACGHSFYFWDGGPSRSDWKVCPYCGKPIAETQVTA